MLAAVTRRAAEALGCERGSIWPFDAHRARLLAVTRHSAPMHVGDDAELLRRTGLFVCRDGPVPKSAGTARFADECMKHFATIAPVCTWLARVE